MRLKEGSVKSEKTTPLRRAVAAMAVAGIMTAGCAAEDNCDPSNISAPPSFENPDGGSGGSSDGNNTFFRFNDVGEDGFPASACRADVVTQAGSVSISAEVESSGDPGDGSIVLTYNYWSNNGDFYINGLTSGGDWTPNQPNTVHAGGELFGARQHFNVFASYYPPGTEPPGQYEVPMGGAGVQMTGCNAEGSFADQNS